MSSTTRTQQALLSNGYLFDHDLLGGNVAHSAVSAGWHFCDLVDDFRARDNSTEDRVAVSVLSLVAVQETVVVHVDKELAGRAVGVGSSRHRKCVLAVLDAIASFVFDRPVVLLLVHISGKATALDHEPVDNPMKNRTFVEPFFGVSQKVLAAFRRFFRKKLDGNITMVGC